MVNDRFLETEAFGATIFKIEIGIIGFTFESASENLFERAAVHTETIQKEFFRLDQVIRHRLFPSSGQIVSDGTIGQNRLVRKERAKPKRHFRMSGRRGKGKTAQRPLSQKIGRSNERNLDQYEIIGSTRLFLLGGGRYPSFTALTDLLVTASRFFLARLFSPSIFGSPGKLDNRNRCSVATPNSELNHPRVAAWPLLEARRNLVEELFHSVARLHEGESEPPCRKVTTFTERHHTVGVAAQFIGRGIGGLNPLMLNQAQNQIAEKGFPMGRGAAELAASIHMTHRRLPPLRDAASGRFPPLLLFPHAVELAAGR